MYFLLTFLANKDEYVETVKNTILEFWAF